MKETLLTISIDTYNQTVSVEVAEPLRASEGGDTKAKVLIIYDGETDNTDREKIL